MKSVAEAVSVILTRDEIAIQALKRGVLNFSAYAQEIHDRVQQLTWKEVKPGTIVVALSRLAVQSGTLPDTRPLVKLDDISIRSPLCDISFDKSTETKAAVEKILQLPEYRDNTFFTITEGVKEITVIAPDQYREQIITLFKTKPKAVYSNVFGISARFSPKYLEIPNLIYAILGELAVENINLVEIVSTYTELTVVVEQHDSEASLRAFQRLLH